MILFSVLIIHGLIHLLGFYKAFGIGKVDQLKKDISKPAGIFWLLTALLFITASILFLIESDGWWIPAAPALIISQILIIISWQDAKFGTAANLIIIFPLIIACIN